jgi:hypothetical protein
LRYLNYGRKAGRRVEEKDHVAYPTFTCVKGDYDFYISMSSEKRSIFGRTRMNRLFFGELKRDGNGQNVCGTVRTELNVGKVMRNVLPVYQVLR